MVRPILKFLSRSSLLLIFLMFLFQPGKQVSAGFNEWTGIGPVGTSVTSFAVSPNDSAIIFVGSGAGIQRTTNGGAEWTTVNTGLLGVGSSGIVVYALAMVQSSNPVPPGPLPMKVYAGYFPGGIAKSGNGGEAWSGSNSGITTPFITSITIDPTNPETVYVGTGLTFPQGVFKTINGGTVWEASNTGLTTTDVRRIVIDPNHPQTLWAGTAGGVFQSINGASNWSSRNAGLLNTNVFSLAIHPGNSNILYAGTGEGIFRSVDKGNAWAPMENALRSETVRDIAIQRNSPEVMYALTLSGVYRSANAGTSWVAITKGLEGVSIRSIQIDPVKPDVLYAGTEDGIFMFRHGSSIKGLLGFVKSVPETGLPVPPQAPVTIGLEIPLNRSLIKTPVPVDITPQTVVRLHQPTLLEGEAIRADISVRGGALVAEEIREVRLVSFLGKATAVPSGSMILPAMEAAVITVDTNGLGPIMVKLTPQTVVQGSKDTLQNGDDVEIATIILHAEFVAVSLSIE